MTSAIAIIMAVSVPGLTAIHCSASVFPVWFNRGSTQMILAPAFLACLR